MGVELPISAVRQHPEKFPNVRRLAESDDFFMMQEYNNVKAYYEKLWRRIQDEEDSDDLFDQVKSNFGCVMLLKIFMP